MEPTSVFQPIVDLTTGTTVGYEALARGLAGEPPAALFAAAREQGRLAELDWACRAAAARGALDAGLGASTALFVNIEPEVIGTPPPADAAGCIEAARRRLTIFLEITERAITDRPAELLDAIELLRADGAGIALDDVGVDPRSLALLPVLRPDVIKLDMSLVRDTRASSSALVMNAVWAHAEATGAAIVAEGIETEEHLLIARTLGASLGQGWYFGRPGPLPSSPARSLTNTRRLERRPPRRAVSPVEVVAEHHPLRPGRKDLLLAVTKRLEAHARALGKECVVVSTFQEASFFSESTRRRYAELASGAALVAALGVGLPAEPAPGVRGAPIDPHDPLRGEWDIAVIGPHFAAALVSQDLGDSGPDNLRRFGFTLTFEREKVVDVVQSLLSRVVALPARSRLAA